MHDTYSLKFLLENFKYQNFFDFNRWRCFSCYCQYIRLIQRSDYFMIIATRIFYSTFFDLDLIEKIQIFNLSAHSRQIYDEQVELNQMCIVSILAQILTEIKRPNDHKVAIRVPTISAKVSLTNTPSDKEIFTANKTMIKTICNTYTYIKLEKSNTHSNLRYI